MMVAAALFESFLAEEKHEILRTWSNAALWRGSPRPVVEAWQAARAAMPELTPNKYIGQA